MRSSEMPLNISQLRKCFPTLPLLIARTNTSPNVVAAAGSRGSSRGMGVNRSHIGPRKGLPLATVIDSRPLKRFGPLSGILMYRHRTQTFDLPLTLILWVLAWRGHSLDPSFKVERGSLKPPKARRSQSSQIFCGTGPTSLVFPSKNFAETGSGASALTVCEI